METICSLILALLLCKLDMASPIPLIDFSTPQTSEQLAGQVLDALASVGFLHVAGLPGLDKETIANAFSIVRCSMPPVSSLLTSPSQHKDLYDSPVAERLSCPHDFATRNGHQRFKDMSLGEKGGGADSKEAFVYGHHGTELGETDQPLPPALERRRDEVQQFKETCHAAFCDLLDKISIAMKVSRAAESLQQQQQLILLPSSCPSSFSPTLTSSATTLCRSSTIRLLHVKIVAQLQRKDLVLERIR